MFARTTTLLIVVGAVGVSGAANAQPGEELAKLAAAAIR
jgi:uncharacterized protein GlcG (DUF336 family)